MNKSLYFTDHQAILNKLYHDFISTSRIFRNFDAKYLKTYGCSLIVTQKNRHLFPKLSVVVTRTQKWDTNLPHYIHAYKSQFFSDTQFISMLHHIFLHCKAQH